MYCGPAKSKLMAMGCKNSFNIDSHGRPESILNQYKISPADNLDQDFAVISILALPVVPPCLHLPDFWNKAKLDRMSC